MKIPTLIKPNKNHNIYLKGCTSLTQALDFTGQDIISGKADDLLDSTPDDDNSGDTWFCDVDPKTGIAFTYCITRNEFIQYMGWDPVTGDVI